MATWTVIWRPTIESSPWSYARLLSMLISSYNKHRQSILDKVSAWAFISCTTSMSSLAWQWKIDIHLIVGKPGSMEPHVFLKYELCKIVWNDAALQMSSLVHFACCFPIIKTLICVFENIFPNMFDTSIYHFPQCKIAVAQFHIYKPNLFALKLSFLVWSKWEQSVDLPPNCLTIF